MIIDDEVLTLNNLKRALTREGYEVLISDNGENGLAIYRERRPNLVLVDLMLPGIDGLEVLKRIKAIDPETVVIMITAYEILEKAVQAMKLGAYDYLLKPFKLVDLKIVISRALELQQLRLRISETIETEKGKYYFGRIIAKNQAMKDTLETAHKIASLDKTTVLLKGESGTGKELLARAIHYNSKRLDKPFVEINCAAIPETLLESELFGYEPGAFTDAKKRKIGLLEKANMGTLFLDEIADMSLPVQAKVLKVLEEQVFTRLGGTQETKCNVRVIAATNKNLQQEISAGRFREDLFYRLNVVPLEIPPLRARTEDIIPLALTFMQDFNHELHRTYKGITGPAAIALTQYSWPGNVRELKNVIERIMSLNDSEEIKPEQLPQEIRALKAASGLEPLMQKQQSSFMTLDELERKYIKEILTHTQGNKTKAAQILGIHSTSLFRKLKKRK